VVVIAARFETPNRVTRGGGGERISGR